MNFWHPAAASFGGVFVLLHLLYKYNGVYPRLYERPLVKRTGGCVGYLCEEKRSLWQLLYWLDKFFVLYFVYNNYDVSTTEYTNMTYAALTIFFILEIFFVYKLAFSKEARDYNVARTIRACSIGACMISTIFYAYSDIITDVNTFTFLFFCGRTVFYDGFLYAFGGCSGDHQMAQSAITQNGQDEYAAPETYGGSEGARIFVPGEA